jgi:hypothetical protein
MSDSIKTTTSMQVTRTSSGLVDALFNSIDRLNAKEIDAEHARAISHTAKTIVSVASLELEMKKFTDANGTKAGALSSLAITSKA